MKKLVRKAVPGLYQWARFKWGHPAMHQRAAQTLVQKYGRRVLSGPFQGMHLSETVTGSFIPKLIGSYELELVHCVEQIIAAKPSRIVDVGCGEGYYLVGFGTRLPDCELIGYDISEEARAACVKQASQNGVSVDVRGSCSCEELQSVLTPGTLLILDCEGYENVLLNPVDVPALQHTHVLVELHELFAPGITRQVQHRFSKTHEITMFTSEPRRAADFRPLQCLAADVGPRVIDESRYGKMQWAWIKPVNSTTT